VTILVIGVLLGWAIHKAREQGIAVAALEKMGCGFSYDDPQKPPTALERLRKLLGEVESSSVFGLHCKRSQLTDVGLTHLAGLTHLKYQDLHGTQVTDAGLVHLQGLTQLRHLRLEHTQVTGVGVRRLQTALPKCTINSQLAMLSEP